jgi:DNA-binding NarL/FixJ family response regulator
MTTPPTRPELHLLLATNRAAVEGFFTSLAGHRLSIDVVVERIGVSTEELAAKGESVAAADVAAVDVALDATAGLAVCEELQRRRPMLPITAVVCCPHSITPWELRTLLHTGVSSVLDLQSTRDDAIRVLESAAEGGFVLHLHLRRGHRGILRDVLTGRAQSEMQMQLLRLVTQGLPDHEIARRVYLSPHTVKHHIEQLRNDVGVRNRTELAAWAGRHGFYTPERGRPDDLVPVRVTHPGGV